jgi:hypothetical protein
MRADSIGFDSCSRDVGRARGAADEQHLVADLAAETRMHVRGQQRADEIAG